MLNLNDDLSSVGHDPKAFDDEEMFHLAPVSLWLEDFSGLKALFDQWRRAGIEDIRRYIRDDIGRLQLCSDAIRVIKVNRKTLSLFDARDLDHIAANLTHIFRKDRVEDHIEEIALLWEGQTDITLKTANCTISGRRLDIQLHKQFLPGYEDSWERVLVAIEDITERETALRRLAASEDQARGLFEHSPVSLWVEDFRGVKRLLDEARRQGIQNFRVFTDVHPEFVTQCMSEIHVLDVNQHTLTLFGAKDKPTLLKRLGDVFRDNMRAPFREQLADLWDGKLFQQREVVNYSLEGHELHLHLQFSVFPGHESDWSLVQVALTDITARKKAEAYLEFLGKHDVLTKMYNRSFYNDEVNRLERKNNHPVTVIIADLNGLKATNDTLGHGAGDKLLVRAGEVLGQAIEPPNSAARIGGDEFAVLLPDADERDGEAAIVTIQRLLDMNNQYHSGQALSFSIGTATRRPGERLEETAKRADDAMYEAKRAHYAGLSAGRRHDD